MHAKRDIVCPLPSVRPSVTFWYCTHILALFHRPVGASFSRFEPTIVTDFQRKTPLVGGALNTRGWEEFATEIITIFSETVRDMPMVTVDH